MISLKRHMDAWEGHEARARAAMEAYIGTLQALEAAAAEMARGEGRQLREDIAGILSYLNPDVGKAALEKSRTQADAALRALVEVLSRREYEYKQIIRLMAEAGATMAQTGAAHSDALRQEASKVEDIARLESLTEARRQLGSHVIELRTIASRAQEEGEQQAKHLKHELEQVREKLQYASALAEKDALTELGNRRCAENAVEAAVAEQVQVSVLMMDLNGFKAVNDTYGHAQGDSLLRLVANHVRRCLREADVVCRWGGDEFVVVMRDIALEVAHATAERIHREVFGEFVLGRAGENVRVNIGASIGAAEFQPGDTAESLLERADKEMYEQKRQQKAKAGARAGR